jgi:glucokinase
MRDRVHIIGLDIGGTKIAGGIVSFPGGELIGRREIPTRPERPGEKVLADVVGFARELASEAARASIAVAGIGAGVAELVDHDGNVTSRQTIRWLGVPVRQTLSELAPAVVEADVRAAARAEAMLGAGRPFRLFVYVTVGTGISYCLVQDGKPYAGARGGALVFATGALTTTCTECGAELHPVIEEFASGPGLVRRYNKASGASLSRGEDVVALARNGDSRATEIVRSAGKALGVGVAWLVNTLDPEAVVVGGGLGISGGLYWDSFVESARGHIWSEAARPLPILTAVHGTDAGIVGAACAFLAQKNLAQRLRS